MGSPLDFEEAAARRGQFLEALLQSATDYAIISMDLDGLVTIWNEGARRVLGWSSEEIIGQPASVFFTLEDRQKGVPQIEMRNAIETGCGSDERWHERKDGSRFWASGEMMPFKDRSGSVQGFIKILRDRTEQRQAAEKQHADAEFLRSVLKSSGDCIKVLDLDANLLFMSEGGLHVMEVSDFNAIRGCPWPSFWEGEGHDEAKSAVEVAKSGGTGSFLALGNTMAGNPRWWDVQVTPILGIDGKPEKLLSVSRDVTETRRAEQRLREAQGLNSLILDSSRDCIVVLDLDGNIQFVSPGGVIAMDVADVAAILSRSWLEAWRGPTLEAAQAALALARTGGTGSFQGYCPTFKGTPKWWDVAITPLSTSPGGASSLVAISRDITDRMAAERELAASEGRFRSLAQSMPNHVWTATADGYLDWFNERVYAFSGSTEGALDGNAWAAIVHPEDVEAATQVWANALATGQPYQTEFRLRRHDGTYRWHIARAVPNRATDDGVVTRWIGTNTDIEDQKAAEIALADLNVALEQRVEARTTELLKTQNTLRQSQKMESIGNLTGGVAHDFNNLLQVISGNLQLLTKHIKGNETAQRRVHAAMTAVTRGSQLASQLLSFGRRQPLAPKVVDVGRMIRNMDEILRRALGEGIEIETLVAGGLWNTLIDPTNVENAVLNLAINARDAMGGQGRLTIEAGNAFLDDAYAVAHPEVNAGQYVLVAVSDTGSGMSPEIVEQVFEPFFTTKPEGKGTGLGLSMVYGFVKQSGGHIKIYSEVGHGTTIKLYLPRSTQSEDVLFDVESLAVTGGNETILVVEDDEAVRDTVVATLTDLGYRTLRAKDAQSALTIVESGTRIDLLFTDVVMPGSLKSTELARKALDRLPDLCVLFTSGYTENSIVHGGRLDDNVELISKPHTREALARKIRHVLANGAQKRTGAVNRAQDAEKNFGETSPKPLRILVCEDNGVIRLSTIDMLEELGHFVVDAATAGAALAILSEETIDILIADVGLPDMSGVDLVRKARSERPSLAVIYATGHSNVPGAVMGPSVTKLGKPYTQGELAAAIVAVSV